MPRKKLIEKKNVKKKQNTLTIDVYDSKGSVKEQMDLPKEVFAATVNPTLMAQAVRVYLANQRQGTSSTKSRGEVKGSTRKIYRQKGTGRARHGGIRAPIFVHGGIAHGPKPKDRSLTLPIKMRRKALFSALSTKLHDKEIKVVSGLEQIEPKTKVMVAVFKHVGIPTRTKTLLIMPDNNQQVYKSARNIADVHVMPCTLLNTYEVLSHKQLLLMKEAVSVIEKTFVKEK